MTYKEYRKREQEAFNALPIFWAFSNEQFKKAMEERGLTENDTDQIFGIGGGGFYLRKDAEQIKAFMNRPDKLRELMENDEKFAESAFYYEMANHEYHINWQGDWDVCECFGSCEYDDDKGGADYLKEIGYSDKVVSCWFRAKNRFLKDAERNGWY